MIANILPYQINEVMEMTYKKFNQTLQRAIEIAEEKNRKDGTTTTNND